MFGAGFTFSLKPKIETVKLGEEQIDALKKLEEFVSNKEKCITLSGSAGTGKTTILREFIDYLDDEEISYALAAPTHKAKLVIEALTGNEAQTVHQLLALSPNIEIFALDYRELIFETSKSNPNFSMTIPYNGIVIVDEASMINDDLFQLLIDKCGSVKAKIVFVGDIKQIQPVKAKTTSKVFNLPNIITLTKIYRQAKDSPVLSILSTLRDHATSKFETMKGEHDSFNVYNSAKDFMLAAQPFLKESVSTKNVLNCKILAYTNARVNSFNNVARKVIFEKDSDKEFNKGEILTGYDNFEYDNYKFWNSLDYVITNDPFQISKRIPNMNESILGYNLELYDSVYKSTHSVFVISRENDTQTFINLSNLIETTRLRALELKSKGKRATDTWKRYFETLNSFATPFNLFYDNRVIKKKTFDYGYASTVHKSQGSSYNRVFVDMGNIGKVQDSEELRQLQYVAVSRTRGDAYILV